MSAMFVIFMSLPFLLNCIDYIQFSLGSNNVNK